MPTIWQLSWNGQIQRLSNWLKKKYKIWKDLSQEKTLNYLIGLLKYLPTKKNLGPNGFTDEFYKHWRDNTNPTQPLSKLEVNGTFSSSFYPDTKTSKL